MINYMPSISNVDINSVDTLIHLCHLCHELQYATAGANNECESCGSTNLHVIQGALSYVGVRWMQNGVDRCGQVIQHNEEEGTVVIETAGPTSRYLHLDVCSISGLWADVSGLTITQLHALKHLAIVRDEMAKRMQPMTDLAKELASNVQHIQEQFSRGILTADDYIMWMSEAINDTLDQM